MGLPRSVRCWIGTPDGGAAGHGAARVAGHAAGFCSACALWARERKKSDQLCIVRDAEGRNRHKARQRGGVACLVQLLLCPRAASGERGAVVAEASGVRVTMTWSMR